MCLIIHRSDFWFPIRQYHEKEFTSKVQAEYDVGGKVEGVEGTSKAKAKEMQSSEKNAIDE